MHTFYILAHPRCGTKWFARFFTTGRLFCYHEALGKQCYLNIDAHIAALNQYSPPNEVGGLLEAQYHRLTTLYPDFSAIMRAGGRYTGVGDSDCALPSIALALAEHEPNAKFAILVRNGMDASLAIEAGMARNPSRLVDAAAKRAIAIRLGYTPNTQFEIAMGRWVLYMLELTEMYEALPSDRVRRWQFEEIFNPHNLEPLQSLWEFLVGDIEEWDTAHAQALIETRINAGGHNKPPGDSVAERWRNLDAARRGSYIRIVNSFWSEAWGTVPKTGRLQSVE